MHFPLDGRGSLYAQLVRTLKDAVLGGRLASGMRFPPTRLLAQELGLSRNTVLAAYEQLRAEGFLQGQVGSGSYVATPVARTTPTRPLAGGKLGERITPPSDYAVRLRQFHDHSRIPGRAIPGMRYSFQYGFPYTNPMLASSWARALAHAAAYTRPGYPVSQGLPALRQTVCDYLAQRRGVLAAPEDVVIVMGTQQAIALTARVLLNPGDAVAIEDPQYFAISEVLQVQGARLLPVPVDNEGLRCDALPLQPPRLVCVTPSHQFPTGALMSLPRRLALLEYAHRHDCWIFEDDYDGEFRYDSRPHAALRSLDEDRRVIYVGSFSKVLFPALRLAYLVVPASLRRDFIAAKWVEDFGSPAIEQAALAHFMADGSFERHLRRTAKTLKQRRTVLLDGLRQHAGDHIDIADSHAGMHVVVWLRGRDAAQGEALIAHAASQGLGLYSIAPYYLQPPDRAGLLMGFGGLSVAEIQAATELFARCLREV